ncbi:MAG: protein translocase subunit SecD [Niabella sp.]|nr:MAG: protein translocase subunit SecD [Niabella sp.]
MLSAFKNPKYVLFVVFLVSVLALMISLPRMAIKKEFDFSNSKLGSLVEKISPSKKLAIDTEIGGYSLNLFNGWFYRDLEIKQGLDISGGASVLLDADMSKIADADRAAALESLKSVIERRVNLLGITEANVQTIKSGDKYRVLVELAGTQNTQIALNTIGQVAQLKFKVQKQEVTPENSQEFQINPDKFFQDTDLGGADLRRANIVFGQANQAAGNTSAPEVQLVFNVDGTKKFRDLTQANIGNRIGVFLDNQLLIAPEVKSAIPNGEAVISGNFTIEDAKVLAAQFNGGALPVPVQVAEQRIIGATLGQESVNKSVKAGLIGLAIVILFMIFYYGRLGFLAGIALTIYALITLAIYKVVPIVLTLPGLTGFILSIGMAVDANILIFERIKEELRMGKPLKYAIENGFGRSWDSIRDANVTTLGVSFILFNPFDWSFFPNSGLVRGFALTLALGIFISLFTGVFITRNLVRVFYHPDSMKKSWFSFMRKNREIVAN